MILKGGFHCSYCGIKVQRSVDADQQKAGHALAYFCTSRCSDRHRKGGLSLLRPELKLDMKKDVGDDLTDRQIADKYNLSFCAVVAALRSTRLPDGYKANRRGPYKKKKKDVEDDIFAPLFTERKNETADETS